MSELAIPEPERREPTQKIHATCWHCNKNVQSSLANCLTKIFTKQPWNSYTALGCLDKQCQAVTILFHDKVSQETAARGIQYPTTIEEFCEEADILEVRRSVTGAHEVPVFELSDRQSKIIEHWGEFLQASVVDITDFENFT